MSHPKRVTTKFILEIRCTESNTKFISDVLNAVFLTQKEFITANGTALINKEKGDYITLRKEVDEKV